MLNSLSSLMFLILAYAICMTYNAELIKTRNDHRDLHLATRVLVVLFTLLTAAVLTGQGILFQWLAILTEAR